MPFGDALTAALAYAESGGATLGEFLGMMCSSMTVSSAGAGGNGRFVVGVGVDVAGAEAYLTLVYSLVAALLAPRFRAALGPLLARALRGDRVGAHWYLESSRSRHWSVMFRAFYVDGLLLLEKSLADHLDTTGFLAHFGMGAASWDPGRGITFPTAHLHPDTTAFLLAVFRRHGMAPADLDAADGRARHLLIRREDAAGLQAMQAFARAHFHPSMFYRVGLGPDGAPL